MTLTNPSIRDSTCILDSFVPLIKKLITTGKKTKEIYQIMKENGYKGKMTVLNMHMKSIKSEIIQHILKEVKLRNYSFMILKI